MWTKKDLQVMEQLRRTVQIFAASLPVSQAREVAAVYPAWEPDMNFQTGQYFTHGTDINGDPLLYEVIKDHTSQEDWSPEDNPSLYKCISLASDGHPIWSPPTGAQDAYNAGDVVFHDGQLWQSKIDGNTTEPGTDDRWWAEQI